MPPIPPMRMSAGMIVMFDTELSTLNRQKVEGYLAHRYALTAALPSNHPHKTTPP